jgi:hypothetical protein
MAKKTGKPVKKPGGGGAGSGEIGPGGKGKNPAKKAPK